jgi:peroxiredoxin
VVDKLGLEFPVLSDSDRRAINAYGVVHSGGSVDGGDIARPATFIIGPDGRVEWRNLTENWRVRVRPDELIDALQDLR